MKNSFFIKTIKNKPSVVYFLFLLSLVFVVSYFSTANASEIQAFGISTNAFENTGNIKPCYLDVADSDIAQINIYIKNQSNINEDNLKSQYANQFNAISQSTICQFQAKQLEIKKLPAIVFDNKYVIYGINNVAQAKLIFSNYQDANL